MGLGNRFVYRTGCIQNINLQGLGAYGLLTGIDLSKNINLTGLGLNDNYIRDASAVILPDIELLWRDSGIIIPWSLDLASQRQYDPPSPWAVPFIIKAENNFAKMTPTAAGPRVPRGADMSMSFDWVPRDTDVAFGMLPVIAINNALMPYDFRGGNFHLPTTRAEFSYMIMDMLKAFGYENSFLILPSVAEGTALDSRAARPYYSVHQPGQPWNSSNYPRWWSIEYITKEFPDVPQDVSVYIDSRVELLEPSVLIGDAAALGIVSGYPDGRFGPDDTITREQAAVMLSNALRALCIETSDQPFAWTDISGISDWAIEHVNIVYNAGLMSGIGGGAFGPKERYTREQTVTTIIKLYEYAAEKGGSIWGGTPPEQSEVTISLDKTSYGPGETMQITVEGITKEMTGETIYEGALAVVYKEKLASTTIENWNRLSIGANNFTFIAPRYSGTYIIRVFSDNTRETIIAETTYIVRKPDISNVSVSIAKSVYEKNEILIVTVTGVTEEMEYARAYIGLNVVGWDYSHIGSAPLEAGVSTYEFDLSRINQGGAYEVRAYSEGTSYLYDNELREARMREVLFERIDVTIE